MRVLVIEGDAFNLQVVRGMMEIIRPDVDVDTAMNADEVRVALAASDHDLVLSDVEVPGLGDGELIDLIKSELAPGVPVVCVTAYAIEGDRERFLMHGFDEYVSKPIDLERLRETLALLLPSGVAS